MDQQINVSDAIHLAAGLFDDCHYDEAAKLFDAAEQAGGGFRAVNGLGMCLNELERPQEALVQFDKAYPVLRDELAALASNRARALTELGRCDEALSIYDNLLVSVPSDLFRYNRALTLLQMGHHEDCIKACDDVISRNPDDDKAKFARGFARLVLGDYERGFADYECRMKDDIAEPGVPLWTGEQDLRGKTLLVHGEMGLGDNIMFMRYVPMIVERGARVVVVVPDSQRFLVDGIQGAEYHTTDRSTWPKLDYWVRFMSLAHCFKTTRETVPPPAQVKYSDDGFILYGSGKRIGLCWSGSRKSRYDKHRSIPVNHFASLFSTENCSFYSLQKDVREEDMADCWQLEQSGLIDLAPHLNTFEDTAHAMKCMDLVITCDTSVAHMAGTVGVPTWVLLTSFRTYWLWITKMATSPWYPSVRVFRQKTEGDWVGVMNDVRSELEAMV